MNSIRKYRKALNLTQAQLAGKVDLSLMTISRYENAKRMPTWSDVEKISAVLNCTPEQLMAAPSADSRPG